MSAAIRYTIEVLIDWLIQNPGLVAFYDHIWPGNSVRQFLEPGTKWCVGGWRGTVVERGFFSGEVCLSCTWSASDEWQVMGKSSAAGQPTRPSQPFIFLGSINWVVSCNWMSTLVVPSVNAYGMGWRPGVVDWGGGVLASCCQGSSCSLTRSVNGRISAAAPLTLANQLPLSMIVKRGWSGFVPVRRAV